jgi:hypothetical protein
MLARLHDLPDLVILLGVVVCVVAAAMLAPFAGAIARGRATSNDRDTAAFDAYKAVMAMAGVVLAFSLVQANANLREAETMVARETAAFAQVDRALLRFGGPDMAAIRALLAAYGESRVRIEWPSLASVGRDAGTDDRYTALSRAARAIEPASMRQQALYADLLRGLDDLSEDRELLIQDAKTELPVFFWIVSCGFLALGLVLALLTDATLNRAVSLGGVAAGVGLLMAFVMIVDQPFRGETSVSPAPIQTMLDLNSRRQ